MTTIIVKDITRDTIVAQSQSDETVALEGAYYFASADVDQTHLVISERPYTCAYKGVCNWIDLEGPDGVIRDVGWVYRQPRPDYEYIRDKLGFAFGMRPGIVVEKR